MSSRVWRVATAGLLACVAVWANDASPEALMEAGHWKRARAIAETRYRANGNNAPALYVLARIKQASGDLDGALPMAEKLVQLDAKNADYRYLLAGVYGQKAERASIFSQMGLARRFKKEAEAAIQLDPKHIEARMGLIEFYMQAPGIAGGDKARARQLADEITKIDAARGYLAQAVIARREKRDAELEGLYKKAVEANPKSYTALMTLANFYASEAQKKYDLSEKLARDAQKLDAERISAYSLLAGLFAFRERWQDLDAVLALGEKNVPDNLAPYYNAGRTLLGSEKDLPRAERYFRKYLTVEPEPTAPQHAHAHWRLGNVYEKMGRKAEAVASLETALRLKPDLEEAKKDLKRLK
jgi:tetratricopeptide (TPR) repeat protein